MKQLILFCWCSVILIACDPPRNGIDLTAKNLRIINDATSALSARVQFSLNAVGDAMLVITDKGTGEEKRTPVSTEKINHNITITGLKEKTTYSVKVQVKDRDQSFGTTAEQTFTTAAIPADVKAFYKPEENPLSETNGSHFLFNSRVGPACIYFIDHQGKVVWYRTTQNVLKMVRLTRNNTLLCLEDENNTSFGDGNVILELSLGGDTLFYVRQGTKGFDKSVHHDLYLNHRGNVVAVTNVYKPGITIPGDGIIEFDRSGNKIWEWTTFDSPDAAETGISNQPWINSLVQDNDNNYIVSLRSFSQVWKINSTNGAVMWKLGKGGNVQMETADEFQFQHYAHRNPQGDIMLFDNGSATRPVTRLMSFTIDEQQKKATRKLKVELPANLYSAIMGSTMLMPDQSILSASSNNSQFVKMNAAGQVLWSVKIAQPIYRAEYVGNPFLSY